MAERSELVAHVLARLQRAREAAGIEPDDLATELILGPGCDPAFRVRRDDSRPRHAVRTCRPNRYLPRDLVRWS